MTYKPLLIIFLSLILFSCTDSDKTDHIKQTSKVVLHGKTMGTHYHISLILNSDRIENYHSNPKIYTQLLQAQIDALLTEINQQMSTYIPESEISRFNQFHNTDWFSVSNSLAHLVKMAKEISVFTNGAFDITAASLVNLWGFGPEIVYKIPSNTQIKDALQLTGYQLIEVRERPSALRKLKPGVKIDLSAIAKGYAVDQVALLLSKQGYNNYLVEIGGEIVANGYNQNKRPWRIAIENPSTSNQTFNINVTNQAIATSGDYRNFFEKDGIRYSHTIDPKTGKPVTHHIASATVIDKTAARADALATALMVMGEVKAKEFSQSHDLKVYLIIRNSNDPYSFSTWNNLAGS